VSRQRLDAALRQASGSLPQSLDPRHIALDTTGVTKSQSHRRLWKDCVQAYFVNCQFIHFDTRGHAPLDFLHSRDMHIRSCCKFVVQENRQEMSALVMSIDRHEYKESAGKGKLEDSPISSLRISVKLPSILVVFARWQGSWGSRFHLGRTIRRLGPS
jgi:hypothetical protein